MKYLLILLFLFGCVKKNEIASLEFKPTTCIQDMFFREKWEEPATVKMILQEGEQSFLTCSFYNFLKKDTCMIGVLPTISKLTVKQNYKIVECPKNENIKIIE